jgi:inward rectifier potassium channel
VANQRANQIVEASLRLVLLRDEKTKEGEPLRRIHDLKLVRSTTAAFVLSWTVIHPIDDDSPLKGQTAESLAASGAEITASLVGIDETFAQTVHARFHWFCDEIVWGGRFVDMLHRDPDGMITIDYSKFHDILPIQPKNVTPP